MTKLAKPEYSPYLEHIDQYVLSKLEDRKGERARWTINKTFNFLSSFNHVSKIIKVVYY